ncbi:MAG: tRNA-(ms[2]io[6]A)-hydroxylase [Ewingella americana]|jgi:tRNA-(ms[2]io[6]A)-hydroxylase|uniref:tRNA-(ms[2]io[6]A)-hydroxylase n=1 Tax=Ewingella americana TaxID=41202 RepID=UPI002431FB58|nr:tRNA isopentenyl-2-thiomethyl-A-37 hydroxylase MiaE [Ewingella americana]MCI1677422.1 tRNA-(ms[2]io[6]A)-hydroxylase [Ewingella americana]MCI1852889.1 tRNA-(ms[2]io[6]A)-hydroxylase [Ewingella americana]MCI1861025.1 tRNA-(ms[2]io[6]A)-hydroxylase [Ewingella americana]MCI2143987.1 tRNA-(ms[2]io[6]A)-hydroxylase [Ewingella americana]MCI2165773.1 tRNA-(ms[2]io[6]A)-hydroxylase [Ewingella americana]
MTQALLAPIYDFLHCETPARWVDVALENQEIMLIDHANCEKKAAATAMSLMTKYVDRTELLFCAARLAREELHHFEQVVEIMQQRNIPYTVLSPSRYASGMIKHSRHHDELNILVDRLIIGAYIEARSCERFAKIAPHLDETLSRFYTSLLRSEARHFTDYLELAQQYAGEDISERVQSFGRVEAELILSPDEQFRFHSGVPV